MYMKKNLKCNILCVVYLKIHQDLNNTKVLKLATSGLLLFAGVQASAGVFTITCQIAAIFPCLVLYVELTLVQTAI